MARIFKLSEAVSIGLHAAAFLAGHTDRAYRAHEMAEALHVSEAHLIKVLERLARAGVVNAVRGPKGGFSLAAHAADMNLRDVFEAVEGKLDLVSCLMKNGVCLGASCILGDLVQKVNAEVLKYLTDTRLSDLAAAFGDRGAGESATTKGGCRVRSNKAHVRAAAGSGARGHGTYRGPDFTV